MKCALRKRSYTALFALLAVSVGALFSSTPVFAQFSGIGNSGLSLKVNPAYPAPHSETTVSLDDYSVNAVGAGIKWFVNGAARVDANNERSLTVTTGDLGERMTVRAVVTPAAGAALSAETSITPTLADLILEADTYVPSFYKGRSLPSRGSALRAVAVVHDGGTLGSAAYTYRWTLGEDVLFGGPVKGKNVVAVTMPIYSKDLMVEILNPDGRIVARKSMTLKGVSPELHFYEWSPLRGLYQKEVSNPYALIADETTIYGEPYFVNTAPSTDSATFTWSGGGQTGVPAPNAVTLSRDAFWNGGEIALQILTRETVPQRLEKSFNVVTY